MTAPLPNPSKKYDLEFARWVYENVNGGDKLSMCMHIGLPHMIKDRKGLKAILAKAREIEERP